MDIMTIVVSGIVGAILGAIAVGVIKITFNPEWSNREFDTTALIFIGGFLAFLIVVGIFAVHILSGAEKSLLSPEILMAMINMPITVMSYAVGKQTGLTQAQNQQNINGRKQ